MPLMLVPSPIKLNELAAETAPQISSSVVPAARKLPATIVFLKFGVTPATNSPPPCSPPLLSESERLFVTVTLVNRLTPWLYNPPPWADEELPLIVAFVTVRVRRLYIPPPCEAVLPLTVLLITVALIFAKA